MDHQQHIQLVAPSSRGSSANAMPTTMQPNDDDAARSVGMCPSLYRAVYKGETEEAMALLLQQHGAAADYEATGITIQYGQCDILEMSAEMNTVLHVAAEQGHGELIQELFLRFRETNGLLSRRNSTLDTPLHCAARAGNLEAVSVLVQLARDFGETILGCKNEAGDTALHLVASHGHGAVVEALVSAAAEPAAELNNAGVSPLYLAVMSGSVQAVRAVRAITTCRDASPVGPSSQNALHAAVFHSAEMVDLLLKWRPALADQVDGSGSSPLHFAASDGECSIVRTMLRAAPPGTVYKKDASGLSALHVAARMGHDGVVNELLEWCPDAADLLDDNGGTFVHAAAKEKRYEVVSLATRNPMLRGLLHAQDRDGNTPLHVAVSAGAYIIVEALLRKGRVRADVLNNDGHTPLDLAAESKSFFTMVRVVVTLVAFGAQLRPQRQDHLKLWAGRGTVQGVETASDSLAVVAVLIATVAFAAGFNVPGGYSENTGMANLGGKLAFKIFFFLDTFAVATSVVAVILLVYGKVSRSSGAWNSFVWSLHCMWVSLISLLLAFYAALGAVATTRAVYRYVFMMIYACFFVLQICIAWWIRPTTSSLTRFLWQRSHLKGRHVIKRQYPLAGDSVLNWCLYTVISVIMSAGFGIISAHLESGLGTAPAPSPL